MKFDPTKICVLIILAIIFACTAFTLYGICTEEKPKTKQNSQLITTDYSNEDCADYSLVMIYDYSRQCNVFRYAKLLRKD